HTGRHVKTIREFLEQSHVPMILPRRHTESLATATQPDGDTAWPWTTAPRSGYSPSCTAAGAAPWLPHARWLAPRRRPDGASGCQTPRRRRHATPAPAPCPRTSGTPPYRWCREKPAVPAPPSPNAAITLTVPHVVGTKPTARSPRGAQAGVGVMAVLTPVSSTKTSRFSSIRRTFLGYCRRFSCTSG